MINITCENCEYFDDENECDFEIYINCDSKEKKCFTPKEEIIRKDERNKVIELIETSPLIIIDDPDSNKRYYGYKAIEMYREKLLERLKKIKIMED